MSGYTTLSATVEVMLTATVVSGYTTVPTRRQSPHHLAEVELTLLRRRRLYQLKCIKQPGTSTSCPLVFTQAAL